MVRNSCASRERSIGGSRNRGTLFVINAPPSFLVASSTTGYNNIFIAAGQTTMAQSYFPTRVVKEAFHDSIFAGLNGDKQPKVEGVQEV